MDYRVGEGGCCIHTHTHTHTHTHAMDRIMFRFRPIAPKPASTGTMFPPLPENRGLSVKKLGRGKRRRQSKRKADAGSVVKASPEKPLWLSFGSWVKVECVTDTWTGGCGELGREEESLRRLDADTCPCLISDDVNRVRWVNAAYKRMVAGDEAGEVVAAVVFGDGVEVAVGCVAFTCRVKVVTWGDCKTVPCDVWRMECGGFAWRLDTEAALSLALGN